MICVLIQARMSSERLPGKVLRLINNRPMLSYLVERVAKAKNIDKIVVVTSVDSPDDAIVKMCEDEGIDVYRGSLDDVLGRYYEAAKKFHGDIIVRITGDCPLIDPAMIDAVIEDYKKTKCDYIGNSTPPESSTVPDGMDVEVFSFNALERAYTETIKPSDREHVTFYFWKNPDKFSVKTYKLNKNLTKYRMTVDYPEDFDVISKIYEALYKNDSVFSLSEIINFLDENLGIHSINKNITSNQGWQSAFSKDEKAGF